MEIQFLQKVNTPDGIRLSYNIDSKKVYLEITGTATSVYNIYDLEDNNLGMIFIPVISDIYDKLKEQGAELDRVDIDSDGAKIMGKIIYSKECIEDVLKRRSRKLVNGEYWEIKKIDSEDGKSYKIFNTHQKAYENQGTYTPDFIDSFIDEKSAINFLWRN
jgi:hypothetical protein